MKNLLLIVLILFSFNCKAQTPNNTWSKINNTWAKINDDTKHVYAGMLITTVTGELTYRLAKKHPMAKSLLFGFLSGVAAGIAKEYVYDGLMHRGVVNNWDAFSTAWGANVATIGLVISIDVEQKCQDRNEERFQNLQLKIFKDSLQ